MNDLIKRYPALNGCTDDISAATELLIKTFSSGGKLLLCGNGGSAADCEHISGELLKGFMSKRSLTDEKRREMRESYPLDEGVLDKLQMGLAAIPLTSLSALGTAFSNDVDPELIFAQGVFALGKECDTLIAISTSGNSKNVVRAAEVAKAVGMKVIGLAGKSGGKLKEICDVCICAPEEETYKVQEYHLPIYHYLCQKIEKHFLTDIIKIKTKSQP